MMMKAAVFGLLALLPAPAFASFECMILDQCGGGTCEPYEGAPFLIEEVGDVWQVSSEGKQLYEGYSTTTIDLGGAVSIVLPPQDGMSGLISIFPTGEMLFTAHASGDSPIAITASGNCMTEGG
jgi:hypothetical protein